MKKEIFIIVIILLVAIIGMGLYYELHGKNESNDKTNLNEKENNDPSSYDEESSSESDDNQGITSTDKKILVVYYSAQNHTENIAKKVASNLNADIFEIEPVDTYTSDDLNWSNSKSRVSREHADESLRNIELKNAKVENWDSYDTILIGYPIWWGEAAWVVNNFVKDNDFTGKTVIPFCTSASSGLGNSAKLLEDLTKTGNWKSGHRFSSSATDADIKSFTDSIK